MKAPAFVVNRLTDESTEALIQYQSLLETLKQAGADLLSIPPIPDHPSSRFIKDSAVLFHTRDQISALLSLPRHPARKSEQFQRREDFQTLGFTIAGQTHHSFEGGDLALFEDGKTALLGYGIYSDKAAADEVAQHIPRKIIPLQLTDKNLHHLDLALAVLSDSTVFACPEAFSPSSWWSLERLGRIRKLIPVSYEDARNFCLNWIEVDDTVIMTSPSREIESQLLSMKRKVVLCNLDKLLSRRGSAGCLVTKIY